MGLGSLATRPGGNDVTAPKTAPRRGHLSPERYPQRDFFIADLRDISSKDDMPSMEHPLFALKAGDRRVRRYERNGATVAVKPGADGLATIHDKDVWIYCISQLVHALERGREDVSRTVRFTAYAFLKATQRATSGRDYLRFADALGRLSGTRIETNIETDGQRERSGFGLIESWRVIERGPDNRMVSVEVTLPEWLYRSVLAKQVLTIDAAYFRLRKPLDRRLYEIVRKHCGHQTDWKIALEGLHEKSGSTAPLREFRRAVKALASTDELPGYRLALDPTTDLVTVYSRRPKGQLKAIRDVLS